MARLQMARHYLQTCRIDEGVQELDKLIDFCAVKIPDDFKAGSARADLVTWRCRDISGEGYTRLLHDVLIKARREREFIEILDMGGTDRFLGRGRDSETRSFVFSHNTSKYDAQNDGDCHRNRN